MRSVEGRTSGRRFLLDSEALPLVGTSELPEFFGHRLQILTTRATVVDSTAGLGQTPPYGTSSHGVSGLCVNSVAHLLPVGIPGSGHEKAADAGLGPLAQGAGQVLVIHHALGGGQCGEQRGPDLRYSTTTDTTTTKNNCDSRLCVKLRREETHCSVVPEDLGQFLER